MKNRSAAFVLFLALGVIWLAAPDAFGQQTQLSLVDIMTALRSKKATIAEKNQILSEGVKQRGVTFSLNPELEKELRTAGADNVLIASIRAKAPVAKVEPTPGPRIEPAPVATPKPPDSSYYKNRANASFVIGEFDAAITEYTKAIDLDPKDSNVFFSRGMAYLNKKSYASAITDFGRVIELDPTESMAYFNRAIALENTGDIEKAAADMKKAVELDAENELAKTAFARLEARLPKRVPDVPAKDPEKPKTQPAADRSGVTDPMTPDRPINAGSLGDQALKLAVPQYPTIERQNRIEGLVTVQVTLDEEGKVVSAKAVNGPKGLRAASEDAAKRSKFKPVTVEGKPVKATGTVVYNFKLT